MKEDVDEKKEREMRRKEREKGEKTEKFKKGGRQMDPTTGCIMLMLMLNP